MGSFKNPVGEGPQDPYEKYRAEPISERQTKGEKPPPELGKSQKEKVGLAIFLLGLFQKAVNFFLESRKGLFAMQADAVDSLKQLQMAFEIMKKEDRSQDVVFLNQLSKAWIQALEHSLHFADERAEGLFKTLTKKILHYPDETPHTLGYYLTEYAGQKWVPFPYMELIQKMHHEHELSPDVSALTEWSLALSDLIAVLQKE